MSPGNQESGLRGQSHPALPPGPAAVNPMTLGGYVNLLSFMFLGYEMG